MAWGSVKKKHRVNFTFAFALHARDVIETWLAHIFTIALLVVDSGFVLVRVA
jgi:hypothetical protein